VTKHKSNSRGIQLLSSELDTIKEWLDRELLMCAHSVRIIVRDGSGIGSSVEAIALDEKGEEIKRLNATAYEEW
jgi:hypothetical protein